jgi:hypothetical protein
MLLHSRLHLETVEAAMTVAQDAVMMLNVELQVVGSKQSAPVRQVGETREFRYL